MALYHQVIQLLRHWPLLAICFCIDHDRLTQIVRATPDQTSLSVTDAATTGSRSDFSTPLATAISRWEGIYLCYGNVKASLSDWQ